MKAILIFDQLNDIIFCKYDQPFVQQLRKSALSQQLITGECYLLSLFSLMIKFCLNHCLHPDDNLVTSMLSQPTTWGRFKVIVLSLLDDDCGTEISPNVIVQIFSPIVTSQRVMTSQFGNSYTSIQCEDGTNMIFDEYVGFLFMLIGSNEISWFKRTMGICITFVKYICGPHVSLLKSSSGRRDLLVKLLDTWSEVQDSEQSFLIEAVEQLSVNSDLSSATVSTLHKAVDKLKGCDELTRVHALVFVHNKLLSLFSSRNTQDLAPADIVFLSILIQSIRQKEAPTTAASASSESDDNDAFYSPESSIRESPGRTSSSEQDGSSGFHDGLPVGKELNSYLILLGVPKQIFFPHAVYTASVAEGVTLLIVVQTTTAVLCNAFADALHTLSVLQSMHVQRDHEGVKTAFDVLEAAMKRIIDGLKKTKHLPCVTDTFHNRLLTQWDFMKKKYVEYIKTEHDDCLLRIESITSSFKSLLCELMSATCLDPNAAVSPGTVKKSADLLVSATDVVRAGLNDFSNFLQVKALRNFTLGSRASLTINKYLEEFPGLVHFLYVDRSNHRVTAPTLDFSSEETVNLTKKKIWAMVEFSREHLQEGHLAMIWKDTTFNYSYFLWFEDLSGSPLKPKVLPSTPLKNFPLPGVLCGDFYQKLIAVCFPKGSQNKIRCFELYCIHLGLVTSTCVLEQSRRLAATVWEVTGQPGNPLELL